MMASLMHSDATWGNESNAVTIFWPTKYFHETAFSMALRYLYSDSVLSAGQVQNFTHHIANHNIMEWRASQLQFAIVYWLGGLILQAQAVADRAEAIVHGLIAFDIIGFALALSFDLLNVEILGGEHEHEAYNPDQELRVKISDYAEKLGWRLYEMIFTFIASQTTFQDFQLDTTLHQDLIKPLLPITPDLINHYHYHHHQLPIETIQFGQLPPQQPPNPAQPLATSCTSAIMLNLPFAKLRAAITLLRTVATERHQEDASVKDFTTKVVAERETRRRIVKNDPSVSEEEKRANLAVCGALGYQERVVEVGEVGDWAVKAEWAGE
jgi:hypothetical protein